MKLLYFFNEFLEYFRIFNGHLRQNFSIDFYFFVSHYFNKLTIF